MCKDKKATKVKVENDTKGATVKDDEKKIDTTEVEDEKKLTEEELDKASGGGSYPFHPPIIGPDGRVYPPCYD